ncbi:TetR/AcrR family transcriptional regulator [Mycobacterium riyadhense]|uniref:HTH tetR-type domain-containing protein n=1 Tax=Mycobacterium riyadhense TaxID=486698 RepID=A0A1X2BII7_9MYCO|nr:TetR/AcrR family transcriptional regulator [Mycobacterium riyadhense]MCV7147926.1 TetR/AcrR family transcriptional regulator [Mycobacterium riyadhense]ORW63466.1 hypothetical protein AWC22_03295 [Mycobacterium riyadhense]
MPTDVGTSSPDDGDKPASIQRIRDAALVFLAARGAETTSLRMVADAAGVSIGLVQHHFGTKANLIEAVNDHVLTVLSETLATPLVREPADDPVADVADRVILLLAEHTEVVDYISRAIADNTPIGVRIFDALVQISTEHWEQLHEQGLTRSNLDPIYRTLSPLTLVLGTFILRSHLSRHLPEPFDTPAQLERWRNATEAIIGVGQLQRPGHD